MVASEEMEEVSKSQRKRDAQAVEELVRQLLEMADSQLELLTLDSEISASLLQARSIRTHSARKRQLKFLAGLLRREPEQLEQVQTFLNGESALQLDEARRFHQLEKLRDRLCAADQRPEALAELRQNFPAVDFRSLEALLRAYRGVEDKKNYRQIFRWLRQALVEEPSDSPSDESD
ncbi:MAG: DUF615 domain-containing protein [Desulfuromonadaceae bacterium]|nr:DUF615 domain-containing protein [Desulfuromonadaceae bacterium]